MIEDAATTEILSNVMDAVEAHEREILHHRRNLWERWSKDSDSVSSLERRVEFLSEAVSQRLRSFRAKLGPIVDRVPRDLSAYTGNGGLKGRIVVEIEGRPHLAIEYSTELNNLENKMYSQLRQMNNAIMKGGWRKAAVATAEAYLQQIANAQAVIETLKLDLEQARETREENAATARRNAEDAIAATREAAQSALEALPPALQPWSSQKWDYERLLYSDISHMSLYGGYMTPGPDARLGATNAYFGCGEFLMVPFNRDRNMILVYEAGNRDSATDFAQSLLLRELASEEPGKVRLVILDPVGLGASASALLGLAEYDADLIGGQIWSSAEHINAQLDALVARIEMVTQKYLGSRYNSIDEYNEAAHETAVAYTTLVVYDYPARFSDDLQVKLNSIMLNGERCGVRTIVVEQFGQEDEQLGSKHLPAETYRFALGAPIGQSDGTYEQRLVFTPSLVSEMNDNRLALVLEAIGRKTVAKVEQAVTYDRVFKTFMGEVAARKKPGLAGVPAILDYLDPHAWWQGSTVQSIVVPVGAAGARETAFLVFDSSNHAGALLVGRPGSGKSTLLHTFVAAATTIYGPEELELYLIDFKEGVEFKSYATERLPHARCVATESDREFGLSILRSLQTEIEHRAELLRSTGGTHSSLESIRTATGETLPRVVLVFDEFQVLFAQQDKIGLAAATVLEQIIRQGRGFGIHVLLGSQSLAGLDALGAHVPQLLPVRILLPASESDAHTVLGDTNGAGRYLTKSGEGILNRSGGQVEANEPFQGALLAEESRTAHLKKLRALADERGFDRSPVVFEGTGFVPIEATPPERFIEELTVSGSAPVRLRIGAPMALHGVADLHLRREAGANVLVVARYGEGLGLRFGTAGVPWSLLAATLLSARVSGLATTVVDFTPRDEGLVDAVAELVGDETVAVYRRQRFAAAVDSHLGAVRERIAEDDVNAPPKLLILFGVHRARDLDVESIALDLDADLGLALAELVRDGPEVGVHTWVWGETISGIRRRLSAESLREFGWRIAAPMNSDDSHALLGVDDASALRANQLVLSNDDDGLTIRCRPYGPPSADWLTDLCARIGQQDRH